jgi:hypothetical protein
MVFKVAVHGQLAPLVFAYGEEKHHASDNTSWWPGSKKKRPRESSCKQDISLQGIPPMTYLLQLVPLLLSITSLTVSLNYESIKGWMKAEPS